ncbi:MAG: hypothetical protein ACI9LA_001452, partial [Bacteroidia bacterium]
RFVLLGNKPIQCLKDQEEIVHPKPLEAWFVKHGST